MIAPIIIAGPCAAETEQQILATAEGIVQCQQLHPDYTYIFRAGIWKPRTSPDTFQGIGAEGLTWLQHVKAMYHIDVATEVATPEQVNQCLIAGIDYLWVGARTAANPIVVQSIADSMKGKAANLKGILIKNPVNEDAALWIGNIERLEQVGVPVMAVHRGCGHRPCWSMPYRLLEQRPDIPLLIDPSHLTGRASAVVQMCVKAAQMGYKGWMIETHIAPMQALCDAIQQITPSQLQKILSQVEWKASSELDWLRCMIDEVDDDLWNILSKRMDICRQIGLWKKSKGIAVVQPARYQEILQRRIEWGQEKGLDEDTVTQIMAAIHKESVRVQS